MRRQWSPSSSASDARKPSTARRTAGARSGSADTRSSSGGWCAQDAAGPGPREGSRTHQTSSDRAAASARTAAARCRRCHGHDGGRQERASGPGSGSGSRTGCRPGRRTIPSPSSRQQRWGTHSLPPLVRSEASPSTRRRCSTPTVTSSSGPSPPGVRASASRAVYGVGVAGSPASMRWFCCTASRREIRRWSCGSSRSQAAAALPA
ncbi:hypothetical protein AC230_12160 [Streptomyces caatingaensis]|uniref:Uncharacterized protein n=1 Tax=Streptomyces caatingaensis TaxID=1678637 RepID=A0A0K9XFZ3_9ACTN|nr:hypothetical protein AC230_12160 [Streptomyces caatingaensis]